MPSVHTFWWLPEDERAFLEFLDSCGRIVAYSTPWKPSPSEVVATPVSEAILRDGLEAVLLALGSRPDLTPVERHEFPNSGTRYNVVPVSGGLLHYSRGRLKDGKLTRSNLAAYWQTVGPDGRSVPKDPEFLAFGKKVFRWVRRRTPRVKGYYALSDAAKAAEEAGMLVLGDY